MQIKCRVRPRYGKESLTSTSSISRFDIDSPQGHISDVDTPLVEYELLYIKGTQARA